MTDTTHTLLVKKVLIFIGVWQGVVIPSIPEVTEWLKFTSASLGVIIGVITLLKTTKKKNETKK